MKKYFLHLISLLLVFGLTVNECSTYSEINTTPNELTLFINNKQKFSAQGSKLYVYNKSNSKQTLSSLFSKFRNFKNIINTKSKVVLKLQVAIHNAIHTTKTQATFLNEVITSSNYYSSLYIA